MLIIYAYAGCFGTSRMTLIWTMMQMRVTKPMMSWVKAISPAWRTRSWGAYWCWRRSRPCFRKIWKAIPPWCSWGLLHRVRGCQCLHLLWEHQAHPWWMRRSQKSRYQKALDAVRAALEGESSGSDVDMEQEGEKTKEEPGKADESKGPAEPDTARTGEYHWYDDSRLMSEVGDLDEQGRFCIDGRDIVCEGPMTSYDLNEVIRDAIMRGGGDIWKVPDFLAAYTDKNTRKPLYKRVEAPMDGFLKIVPNTGCHFFNYKFYSGVEYGVDYRFGQRNKLSDYEDEVSSAWIASLGITSEELPNLKACHVMMPDGSQSMMCFKMKPYGGTTDWGGLTHSWFPRGKKGSRKIGTNRKQCSGCRHSSRSCSTVRGMVDVFVNKCSRLVSFPTSTGTVQPVSVTVYRPPLTSLRKDCFCILSQWELLLDMATFVERTTSNWNPHCSPIHWPRAQWWRCQSASTSPRTETLEEYGKRV